ncbi:beta strand repeat-containing protein, partial [Flavobacterium sp. RSB2_4_14]|uniref:beta strand repeat-containing protein n=1 Tax=Flavobacterium sp. RSB2_4_14 TaxID=3447665 RepID=UPI003F3AAD0F
MKNTLLFRKSFLFLSFTLLILLNTQVSWGQFSITGTGSGNTYTQNFDSFAGTSVSVPSNWAWTYSDYTPGGFYNRNVAYSNSNSTFGLRDNSSSTDIAFGSKQDGAAYTLTFSVVNNTGAIINGFELTWNIEQYSQCSNATPVAFAYRLNAGAYGLTSATGTGTTAFNASIGTCANLASIAVTSKGLSITGLSLAVGGTANFRFTIGNTTANNAHVGIDDFTMYATAVPPCTPQTINPITASVTKSFGESHSIATTATSGLAVAYSSSNNSVASVDPITGIVTIVGVGGPITLTASQAGNGTTVCAATSVTQSFTVTKATPTISVAPSASGITYGQTLASSTLTGGTASTTGTFAFTSPSTVPNAGTANQGITFTPDDASFYNTATDVASVFVDTKALSITANNVSKANGDTLSGGAGSTAFTSSGLVSPQTIGSVTITYGTGAAAGDPDGTYAGQVFPSNATGGDFNPSNYLITYIPGDITVTSTPTLTPATTTLTAFTTTYGTASTAQSVVFAATSLPGTITTSTAPTGYEVSSDGITYGSTATLSSTGGTLYVRLSATATVLGSYNSQVITLTSGATSATITTAASGNTVSKATPTISVAPTASNITYGETLALSTLTGGTASVVGTFAFTNLATAPNAGTANQGVTFTPTDTDNYNTATTTTSVTVDKALTTISEAPTASSITYGQTLASSILTGGTASVPGSFAFTTPSTAPNVGTANQGITFTPTDFNNYNTATTTTSVTVDKANQTIAAIAPATIIKAIGDAPYSAATTASSGLTVTYSLVSVPSSGVATIASDGTVTILGIGTATITASQAGDGNYNAATSVTQALTVGYPVLAGWDFNSVLNAGVATFAATTFNTNLVSTSSASNITRGPGAALSSGASSFRTVGFQNNGISTANTDFFQTTLTATNGNILSLATITANLVGTSTFAASPGVSSQFAYSLNGTTFTLIGSPIVTIGTPASLSIDVSGISALQNVPAGTTVTFRYYASGQTTTGGWGFNSPTAGTNGLAYTGFFTKTPPTVTTNAATVTSSTAATLNGTVNANGNATTVSFDYGTLATATTPASGAVTGTSNTATSVTVAGLSPNTQYTYKAIASGGLGGTVNGSDVSFYTFANAPLAPTLSNATETTIDVAIGSGDGNPIGTLYSIQLNGGSYIQVGGATLGTAVWQTAAAWASTTVSNLSCGANQTFTVHAKNGADVVTIGTSASLSTTACTNPSLQAGVLPSFNGVCISSNLINNFSLVGSNLTGNVTVNALSGFYFSTDNGNFFPSLTLVPNSGAISQTIYVQFLPTLVQSYDGNILISGGGATSINVAASGSGINTAPSVVTGNSSAVTQVGATVAGTISVFGCSNLSAYGIEFSTTNGFADGTGTQLATTNLSGVSFSAALTGLSPNTVYYYKAYATNGGGTAYGTQGTFTTLGLEAPLATAATAITATSFTANWGTVLGADNYRLDVSTFPTFGISSSNPNITILTNSGTIGASNWIETDITQQGGTSPYLGFLSPTSTSVSPALNLSNFSNISLTFKARTFGGPSAAQAAITVSVSTDGVNWTPLGVSTPISTSLTNPSNTFTYSLNSSTVRVRFQTLSATGSAGVGIDDIIVKGDETIFTPSFIVENLQVASSPSPVTGLTASTAYYYRVRATSTNSTSANSNSITVTTCANAPVITGSYCSGTTTVSGSSSEANGTTIRVYSGSTLIGTTTVANGTWSATVIALAPNAVLTATAQVGSNCESVASASLIVTPSATPTVTLTSSDGDNTFAYGTPVTFTATEANI